MSLLVQGLTAGQQVQRGLGDRGRPPPLSPFSRGCVLTAGDAGRGVPPVTERLRAQRGAASLLFLGVASASLPQRSSQPTRGLAPALCSALGGAAVGRTQLTGWQGDGPGHGAGGRRCCALPAAGATRCLARRLRLGQSSRVGPHLHGACVPWVVLRPGDRRPVHVRPGASNLRHTVQRPRRVGAGCLVTG